jgi:hypothetical protein
MTDFYPHPFPLPRAGEGEGEGLSRKGAKGESSRNRSSVVNNSDWEFSWARPVSRTI